MEEGEGENGSMKVVVYAICKNEAKFVSRWMDSMEEADEVVVLDTGSTDDTVARLRARGARVTQEVITPWRFDVARNRSLELVADDADICVCTDLDEVFHPGWREQLEEAWEPGTGQATYRYTWSFQPDGSEGVVFWYEKIHARHGYQWVHPVHEVLAWNGQGRPGPTVVVGGVQLDHHPDPEKSRGQYLPLLELSVQEDPEDDRNVHYLGREYMFRGRWDDCIRTLKRHLAMPRATWRDERSASMRYIARAYGEKGEPEQARGWYLRAVAEAPHLREPWMDLARMLYQQQEWDGVLYFTGQALAITHRPRTYICEAEPWGSLPHDLRCIAFYHTNRKEAALEEAKKALALEPGNERLRGNVELLEREKKTAERP
jgi:glycosyltransferase involved in cell wall biosynthesis